MSEEGLVGFYPTPVRGALSEILTTSAATTWFSDRRWVESTKEGQCVTCPEYQYSYEGATACTLCPNNTTTALHHNFCSCPSGQYWEQGQSNSTFHAGYCRECGQDTYSSYDSTECTACPEHSAAQVGSFTCECSAGYRWSEKNDTSLHNNGSCEICPENHYSARGSLTCARCPHFKVALPGSELCYTCTLGEYWENDTCYTCPDHLYGNGVHCIACPPGWSADQGFCYVGGAVSSTISYVGAVLTTILLLLAYSYRAALRGRLGALRCKVSKEKEEAVRVDLSDLLEKAKREEEEGKEEEDVCSDKSKAEVLIVGGKNFCIEEQIYEEI